MNYGDIDGTEIDSGDEGNLTPIHDSTIAANTGSQSEPVIAPTTEYVSLTETRFGEESPVAEEPLVPLETGSEAFETEKLKSHPTTWQRVRNFFFGGSADGTARLNNLTQAIDDAPESAVNYVLRAELYMQIHEYALAQSDFQLGYELSETQFELADWGFLDQVMRDRALLGLEKVQRRL